VGSSKSVVGDLMLMNPGWRDGTKRASTGQKKGGVHKQFFKPELVETVLFLHFPGGHIRGVAMKAKKHQSSKSQRHYVHADTAKLET
jgi:hypothetical protein